MAVRADANSDRLQRTANLPASDAVSACFWYYHVANRGTLASVLFLDTASTANYQGMAFQSSNVLALYDTAGSANFSASPAVGEWSFLAFTRSGSALKGYFYSSAGVLTTQTRTFATTFTPGAFTILGNGFDTTQWANGRAAGIKLWGAQLSDAEIAEERFTLLPRRRANLNAFWPCVGNIGAAGALRDYGPSNRGLTAGGTLTFEAGPPVPWSLPHIVEQPAVIPAAAAGMVFPPPMRPFQHMLVR